MLPWLCYKCTTCKSANICSTVVWKGWKMPSKQFCFEWKQIMEGWIPFPWFHIYKFKNHFDKIISVILFLWKKENKSTTPPPPDFSFCQDRKTTCKDVCFFPTLLCLFSTSMFNYFKTQPILHGSCLSVSAPDYYCSLAELWWLLIPSRRECWDGLEKSPQWSSPGKLSTSLHAPHRQFRVLDLSPKIPVIMWQKGKVGLLPCYYRSWIFIREGCQLTGDLLRKPKTSFLHSSL